MLCDISEKPGHFRVQTGIDGIQIVVPREPHDQYILVFLERDQLVFLFPHQDFSSTGVGSGRKNSPSSPGAWPAAPEHRWPRQAPRTGGRPERVSMNPTRR